ncbi:sirohydrochlorin chelatase [Rhodococcus sp. HM1]|uniref:sirohydrochlorin chelatase n=1 Tax=Rhodococcus sp. HM1 TaxID=2937759 RepID=UPI00200B336E|nr:sirohydrochlorin chelatase [Rhodococcus sp. HM1]MCK8670160.1 sirohydrochlorin chelatase [Rhodococcus sp. HM1]
MIPVIAVAHGSRDPRSAQAMAAALTALRARRPGWSVRLAFLDLNAPSVRQALDAVAAEGHRRVVVVPLLLGSAFHARVDLPGILADARVRHPRLDVVCTDVLGADRLLTAAARDHVAATGVSRLDPSVGIAMCAVGSRRPGADAATAAVAPRLLDGTSWTHVRACFATSAPGVVDALAELREAGARRLVVAPWLLAPGLLWDRACDAARSVFPDVRFAAPLATGDAVGFLVERRYYEALADTERTRVLRSA